MQQKFSTYTKLQLSFYGHFAPAFLLRSCENSQLQHLFFPFLQELSLQNFFLTKIHASVHFFHNKYNSPAVS